MGPTIRLIKLFGIPIEINFSWIFIFLLIIYLLGDHFGGVYPWWSGLHQWTLAVGVALLFFLSVLAHELSHSLLAIRSGIPVGRITLFLFGGVSELCHEARRPRTEFAVAIVGPVASVVLALALFVLWTVFRGTNASLEITLRLLMGVNLMLGLFNLLPGFPLDGGRVLRATAWGLTGNYWLATRIAARMGQGTGTLMALGGLVLAAFNFEQFGVAGIWFALIGAFLLVAATTSYRRERDREGLMGYRVADVMTARWSTHNAGTALSPSPTAQREARIAIAETDAVDGQADRRWFRRILVRLPWGAPKSESISDVGQPAMNESWLTPEDTVMDAMEHIRSGRQDTLPVVRDGELLGFLGRDELQRFAKRVLKRETSLRRP